ncbi:MAG: c-type cytochrome [Burkholderiaceae bacterium]|jgi:cytochrome c553
MNSKRFAQLAVSAVFLAFATAAGATDPAPIDQAAAKIAVQVCSNCHGPGGHSISPVFPRLAGQQELYLAAQIKAFRSKERGDPEAHDYMWGMATLLDDPMVNGLALYFSKQPPSEGKPGNPALMEAGLKLFNQGDSGKGIAPCAGCHGEKAQGNAIFPRLAGQHKAYLVRQIDVIQKQLRNSPIMHGVVQNLTPDQIQAVTEYLSSL